jgi:hypothetical protein
VKIKLAFIIAALAAVITIAACDNLGTINSLVGGIKYSVQVKNSLGSRASRALDATDNVELYFVALEYCFTRQGQLKSLFLISDGQRTIDGGSGKHYVLNNAGWYNVHTDLEVVNQRKDVHVDYYPIVLLRFSKLRVNGVEYDFPNEGRVLGGGNEVIFGKGTPAYQGGVSHYPNNFDGMTVTTQTTHITTVITIDPDIIEQPNTSVNGISYDNQGLSDDPYKHIRIEGVVSN